MHRFIVIIILIMVVNNTFAEENSCIRDYDHRDYNEFHRCDVERTICTNLTSAVTSLRKHQMNCNGYYGNAVCEELIISRSLLTKINDTIIDYINFCKLIKLTINSSNIISISDDAFYSFSDLVLLNLNNNQISHLKFLSYLINLYSLSLERNNLREIDAKNFRQLRKLKILNLAHNNIQILGNSSYNLESLEELYLNNNNISILKSHLLSKLKRLKILNMAHNQIKSIEGDLLKSFTLLWYVNFENNKISAISDWEFPRSVSELYLQNNTLKFSNKTKILIEGNMLNLIDISGCNISILDNIFTSIASVITLKMSNCSINEIAPFAFNSLNRLTLLDLSKNNLKLLQANSFAGLDNLQKLSLEQNQIKIITFQSFSGLSNLRTLDITVEDFNVTNFTFKALKSVQKLHFVDSSILLVNNGSFSSIKYLKYLQLKNTSLRQIEEEGFSNVESLICVSSMCIRNENFYSGCVFNLSGLSLQLIKGYGFQSVNRPTYFYLDYNNITVIPKNMFSASKAEIISFNYSGIRNIEPNAFQDLNFYDVYDRSIFINNNNISTIKKHSFANIIGITNLIMRNNNIEIIEEYAFENLNFDSSSYHSQKISKLDLSNNFLSTIQSNTFFGITNVQEIVLDDNVIEILIPGAFNGVNMSSSFSTLSLDNNQLTHIDRNTLIGISNMNHLILSHNRIIKIDKGAFNTLSVTKFLNLSYNDLKVIEDNTFVGLEKLSELYLDNNKLQTLMFNSFHGLEFLKVLKLGNNQLKTIPLGTFRILHSLKTLELYGNEMEKLTAGLFSNMTHIEILNLGNNNLSVLDITALYPLRELQHLYINNNSLSYIDYLSLKSHVPSLNSISLNFNYFDCTFLTTMLNYFFRDKYVSTSNLIPNKIFHHENVEGILCFTNENSAPMEKEKSRNASHKLQHSIFSILSINPNKKNFSNETSLENILKNITNLLSNRNDLMEKASKDLIKNITNLYNSSITLTNLIKAEKNLKNNNIETSGEKNNGDYSFKVFISMTAFAILLLLLIKRCNKTYFYRIKSTMCRKRKPEIELIDTSEN